MCEDPVCIPSPHSLRDRHPTCQQFPNGVEVFVRLWRALANVANRSDSLELLFNFLQPRGALTLFVAARSATCNHIGQH